MFAFRNTSRWLTHENRQPEKTQAKENYQKAATATAVETPAPEQSLLAIKLTAVQTKRGQRLMFWEGNIWSLMNTVILANGTIMVAFALYLKADNFVIGLMNSLPLFAALLQLWTPQIVARLGSRKKASVITLGIARYLLIHKRCWHLRPGSGLNIVRFG